MEALDFLEKFIKKNSIGAIILIVAFAYLYVSILNNEKSIELIKLNNEKSIELVNKDIMIIKRDIKDLRSDIKDIKNGLTRLEDLIIDFHLKNQKNKN